MTDLLEDLDPELRTWTDQHWPDLRIYIQDMRNAAASERVVIIIGSAMLDIVLRRLLAAFMVEDGVANELMGKEGSGGEKPLASFSARIKACYALGLIDGTERKALDTVREMRNAYAHRLSDKIPEQSFDDRADNLISYLLSEANRKEFEKDPLFALRQWKLIHSMIHLTVALVGRVQSTQRRKPWDGGGSRHWQAS